MIDIKTLDLKKNVEYLTKRTLTENGKRGFVVIVKLKDHEKAKYHLKCPNCTKESVGEIDYSKRSHIVSCEYCKRKYVVKRLYSKRRIKY